MTTLYIRNFPDDLHAQLERQARQQHRTLGKHVIHILEQEMSTMEPKTYRVHFHGDDQFYSRVETLDQWSDLDASSETETVVEFLVAAEDCARFERDLDASPAVMRWEEIAGNWPAPVR